jgi:hypothetical protein
MTDDRPQIDPDALKLARELLAIHLEYCLEQMGGVWSGVGVDDLRVLLDRQIENTDTEVVVFVPPHAREVMDVDTNFKPVYSEWVEIVLRRVDGGPHDGAWCISGQALNFHLTSSTLAPERHG